MADVEMTADKFKQFELVRQSGVTNMWDTDFIMSITTLSDEEISAIRKNYSKYKEEFLEDGKLLCVECEEELSKTRIKEGLDLCEHCEFLLHSL